MKVAICFFFASFVSFSFFSALFVQLNRRPMLHPTTIYLSSSCVCRCRLVCDSVSFFAALIGSAILKLLSIYYRVSEWVSVSISNVFFVTVKILSIVLCPIGICVLVSLCSTRSQFAMMYRLFIRLRISFCRIEKVLFQYMKNAKRWTIWMPLSWYIRIRYV